MATTTTTGKKASQAKASGSSAKAGARKPTPVDKKLWPFYILEVLRRHAPEGVERDGEGNRYLTRRQIVGFLEQDYGIDTQVKAVGDNLTRLHDASMDHPELGFRLEYLEGERNAAAGASSRGEKQVLRRGWRWADASEFEPSEVRMLVDTVIASPVIPQNHVKDLVGKLLPLSPEKIVVPGIERVGHASVVSNDFFLNVEVLNEAIRRRRRVEFVLGAFGTDGRLHKGSTPEQRKVHNVVPMQLLISKGRYYLLAHYAGGEEEYKFRIDLMLDVRIDEDGVVDAGAARADVARFREQHAYAMSGKVLNVVLRINKRALHTLFDQFGPSVHFKNEQVDTIDVELRAALYSVLFWALQYYRSVEVLSPPELREVLADAGRAVCGMYAGEPGAVGLAERQSADESINGA